MNEDRDGALNDIERLHEHLPEIDPGDYFDRREHVALRKALAAWPFLASLMKLTQPHDGLPADANSR
jgi:hypothetical protein